MDDSLDISLEDETLFSAAADTLTVQEYFVVDGFISEDQGRELLQTLTKLHDEGQFHVATIGRQQEAHHDAGVRGDEILWLERDMEQTGISLFLRRMESMISYFNRNCYTGIRDYEAHFAMYPPGAYYRRHLDQFRGSDNRKFTFILYLNFGWQEEDGGQLRVYLPGADGETTLDIAPVACRLVCFRSAAIPHEVLLTHKPRYSVTGWWLGQEKGLGFLH